MRCHHRGPPLSSPPRHGVSSHYQGLKFVTRLLPDDGRGSSRGSRGKLSGRFSGELIMRCSPGLALTPGVDPVETIRACVEWWCFPRTRTASSASSAESDLKGCVGVGPTSGPLLQPWTRPFTPPALVTLDPVCSWTPAALLCMQQREPPPQFQPPSRRPPTPPSPLLRPGIHPCARLYSAAVSRHFSV